MELQLHGSQIKYNFINYRLLPTTRDSWYNTSPGFIVLIISRHPRPPFRDGFLILIYLTSWKPGHQVSNLISGHLNFIQFFAIHHYTLFYHINDHIKNFNLHFTLNVSKLLFSQSRGILSFTIKDLFASALRPTFFLFCLMTLKVVCREVLIEVR